MRRVFSEHFPSSTGSVYKHCQNSFPSLTMKFSSGNCRTRSCNGTFTVSLFPRRLYLPEVDCSDQSLAIDDGTGLSCKFLADAILAEQEKELPADHPCLFSVGVNTQ